MILNSGVVLLESDLTFFPLLRFLFFFRTDPSVFNSTLSFLSSSLGKMSSDFSILESRFSFNVAIWL